MLQSQELGDAVTFEVTSLNRSIVDALDKQKNFRFLYASKASTSTWSINSSYIFQVSE